MYITDAQALAAMPAKGFLRAYVDYARGVTDAPVIYHMVSGLTLISAVSPPALCTGGFGGMKVHPHLYGLTVGPSGARKTTAVNIATGLLMQVFSERLGQQPGSDEGFLDALQERRQMFIPEPEMSRFFAQSKGEGYLKALKLRYTEAYDRTPLSRRTRKVNVTPMTDYHVCILGAIATDLLEQNCDITDMTGGFLSRFVIGIGLRERTMEFPTEDETQYAQLVERLIHLKDSAPQSEGSTCRLDNAAKQAFGQWVLARSERARREQEERHASFLERAPQMALKLALLLSLDEYTASLPPLPPKAPIGSGGPVVIPELQRLLSPPVTIPITHQTLALASTMADMLVTSAASLADTMATTRAGRERKAVLRAIPRPGDQLGVPKGTITRKAEIDGRTGDKWLATLIEQGVIQQQIYEGGKTTYVQSEQVPGIDPAMAKMFPGYDPAKPPERVRPDALPFDITGNVVAFRIPGAGGHARPVDPQNLAEAQGMLSPLPAVPVQAAGGTSTAVPAAAPRPAAPVPNEARFPFDPDTADLE